MTLRQYLILMTFCTVLSWAAWGLVVIFVSPTDSGPAGLTFFYASLGLALLGTNAIIGLLVRAKFNRLELVSRLAATSFRQGVWFSTAIICVLILQEFRILTWWIMFGIVLALVTLEFFFLSLKRRV